jgi:hypothetical protein
MIYNTFNSDFNISIIRVTAESALPSIISVCLDVWGTNTLSIDCDIASVW